MLWQGGLADPYLRASLAPSCGAAVVPTGWARMPSVAWGHKEVELPAHELLTMELF